MKRPRIPDNIYDIDLRWIYRLIKYLGGDPKLISPLSRKLDDFFGELRRQPQLRQLLMRFVETARKGDIAWFAFLLRDYRVTRATAWVCRQIERGIGDVAWAALCMTKYGASMEWVIKQLERGAGSVDGAFIEIVAHGYANADWGGAISKDT